MSGFLLTKSQSIFGLAIGPSLVYGSGCNMYPATMWARSFGLDFVASFFVPLNIKSQSTLSCPGH
jgi:hypothetical protein